MTEGTKPDLDAALREVNDWERKRVMLTRWCWLATGKRSWVDAEDIAQEAIAQLFDPAYVRWDPSKEKLSKHLANLARGIIANRRRKAHRQKQSAMPRDDVEVLAAEIGDGEGALANQAVADQVIRAVHDRAAGDELAAAALALFAEGVEALEEQAAATGRSKQDVRNARRRLQPHAHAARRALLGDES